jgi:LysM repeat protein
MAILVEAGDSLSSIAFDHGVTVEALMAANGLTDPDLVYMGQELVIPVDGGVPTTTAPPLVVTVEYGESLSIIAARHGVTVSAIMEENDLTDPDRIYVG